jgi:hypothetical protein
LKHLLFLGFLAPDRPQKAEIRCFSAVTSGFGLGKEAPALGWALEPCAGAAAPLIEADAAPAPCSRAR